MWVTELVKDKQIHRRTFETINNLNNYDVVFLNVEVSQFKKVQFFGGIFPISF